MRTKRNLPPNRKERGQTIALVAFSLLGLLAVGALAIDVATLYVARSEAQRAADAAAIAGAKAFVDSGVTTDSATVSRQTLAQQMAQAYINAIVTQNNVSRVQPTIATPTMDFTTHPGNPTIKVTLTRTNLPLFFARIWPGAKASVTVSATAEAYNSSNSQTALGATLPVAPRCVKPLLVPNTNRESGLKYIDTTTGAVTSSIFSSAVALSSPASAPRCGGFRSPPCTAPTSATAGTYFPAQVTISSTDIQPSCATSGRAFQQSLAGCDMSTYSCGGAVTNANIDYSRNWSARTGQQTQTSLQCAMHTTIGQDILDTSEVLSGGPMKILPGSGPLAGSGQAVNTSSSIMTFPVFDDLSMSGGSVRVIGFVQLFVDSVGSDGSISGHVLNIVGCGNSLAPGTAASGGGSSPIPVRLIHE